MEIFPLQKEPSTETESLYDFINETGFHIISLNAEKCIIYAHPSIEQLLGFSAEYLIQKSLISFSHPSDTQIICNNLFSNADFHTEKNFEFRIKDYKNRFLWVHATVNHERETYQTTLFLTDITSIKKQETLSGNQNLRTDRINYLENTGTWEIDIRSMPISFFKMDNLSDRCCSILNVPISTKELNTDQLQKAIPYSDFLDIQNKLENAINNQIDYNVKCRFTIKEQNHLISLSGKVLYDRNDRPLKMIGICRDNTLEYMKHQKSKMNEQYLKAIYNSSFQEYFIYINTSLQISFFTRNCISASYNLYGDTIKPGKSITDFLPSENLEKFMNILHACLNKQRIHENIEVIFPKGQVLPLQFTFTPIYEHHEVIGIAINIIDRSIKQEYETKLEQKNKALDEYSFLTSHKLRAPLTNILTLSQLLNDETLPVYESKKIKGLLSQIKQQASKIDEAVYLLNSLLSDDQITPIFTKRLTSRHPQDIIVVDDDPIVTKLSHRILTRINPDLNVICFNYPEYAIEYIKDNPCDLILLDINMPVMDGWDFLNKMKQTNLSMDVIIISSSIDSFDLMKASKYPNVIDFIHKPLNPKTLTSYLSNHTTN